MFKGLIGEVGGLIVVPIDSLPNNTIMVSMDVFNQLKVAHPEEKHGLFRKLFKKLRCTFVKPNNALNHDQGTWQTSWVMQNIPYGINKSHSIINQYMQS